MSQPHMDVRRIATLARLELTDEEVASFSGQLDAILGHIAQLSQLEVTGIEPTAYAAAMAAPMRDDTPWQSLPSSALLQNAPDQAQGQVRVPKVVADA
ncbi:MAG: Asp-tRNA(Asn)/Glu-tRNA(Gln) amidotransferase subunit GatC [Verrucomicrobia bacterium]|nr:MAG: Asp-tRNA(Asn)/Glu-tRNA(Gln) amidotransferase subunit GatC [Verrucomicrobiota bacterium]